MPFLGDVQIATRQHAQIGVLEGTEVLFIERLSARQSVVNFTIVGGRLRQAVRTKGYTACSDYLHPDAMGIAMPVHGPEGDVVATTGVVAPTQGAAIAAHVTSLRTHRWGSRERSDRLRRNIVVMRNIQRR